MLVVVVRVQPVGELRVRAFRRAVVVSVRNLGISGVRWSKVMCLLGWQLGALLTFL